MLDKKWKYTTKETMANLIEGQQINMNLLVRHLSEANRRLRLKDSLDEGFSPGETRECMIKYKEKSQWWIIIPLLMTAVVGILIGGCI